MEMRIGNVMAHRERSVVILKGNACIAYGSGHTATLPLRTLTRTLPRTLKVQTSRTVCQAV